LRHRLRWEFASCCICNFIERCIAVAQRRPTPLHHENNVRQTPFVVRFHSTVAFYSKRAARATFSQSVFGGLISILSHGASRFIDETVTADSTGYLQRKQECTIATSHVVVTIVREYVFYVFFENPKKT